MACPDATGFVAGDPAMLHHQQTGVESLQEEVSFIATREL